MYYGRKRGNKNIAIGVLTSVVIIEISEHSVVILEHRNKKTLSFRCKNSVFDTINKADNF